MLKLAATITMPKWGLSMKEGKITKWLKNEGETVKTGEPLFEVETEKITNQVESTTGGVLFQIVVPAGTIAPVGAVVAIVAAPGEQPARIQGMHMNEAVEMEPTEPVASPPVKPEDIAKVFVVATPAARRVARELGLNLAMVPGSGPEGRVTEADVKAYYEAGPPQPNITPIAADMAKQAGLDIATIIGTGEGGKIIAKDVERLLAQRVEAGPVRSIPFAGIRKSIADNMFASLHNTAQLTAFTEVDVTEMKQLRDLIREEFSKDQAVKVSYNDIIILAAARALKRYPYMNSTLLKEEIIQHDPVNMGIAVALEEGLIVPVLRDADKKGLLQIAREVRQLAQKAREGTLNVEEVTEGTFTITNLSMFNVDGFTPILRPPETGILGVGKVKEKPAVHEGEITIRSMVFLSLTFDHRVVDGAPAMAFLDTLARYIQKPTLIML
jgi:pyruvate dehydrogenase E2 component (dihydrolipoamide acetyltransferase)